MPTAPHSPIPHPPRDRTTAIAVLLGGLIGLVTVAFAIAALLDDGGGASAATPPPAPPAQAAPTSVTLPSAAQPAVAQAAPAPTAGRSTLDERRFARNDRQHVRADWVATFYPLYERAAKAFGVNWLLIASVHK